MILCNSNVDAAKWADSLFVWKTRLGYPVHIEARSKGRVSSVGFAVDSAATGEVGALATVESKSGWLRDAQRFPIIISFDDDSARGLRRLGGQADVLVYTSNNWIINPIGWLYIRLLSWLSYVY